jgi:hypothetical protein
LPNGTDFIIYEPDDRLAIFERPPCEISGYPQDEKIES